jgi:hypothetical protein
MCKLENPYNLIEALTALTHLLRKPTNFDAKIL